MLRCREPRLSGPNEGYLMGADHRPLVLLTGASGYVGGRLLKELEKAGWPVRCLARRPDFLRAKVAPSTEVVKADCLDRSSLSPAMAGVHTAYYLVHSMGSSGKFETRRPRSRAKFRRRSTRFWSTTHCLSGRIGEPGPSALRSSAQSSRGCRHLAKLRDSNHRISRIHRDRVRQSFI